MNWYKKSNSKIPRVNFYLRDLEDSGPTVNDRSILKDYGTAAFVIKNKKPEDFNEFIKSLSVHQEYIDISELPSPQLGDAQWEDEEGNIREEEFDYNSYSAGTHPYPPIKLFVENNGKIWILDGNHRLYMWEQQGYQKIPAWVIREEKNELV